MSRFGTHYQVGRPTGVCAASGQPLKPGDEAIAALIEREEDEGFERRDYALDPWQSGSRPERLFSYWRFTVPAPDEQPKVIIDDAVLMDLFERLGDDERPQRQAFRFVLALILMRKRQLKFIRREETTRHEDDEEITIEHWLFQPKGADPEAEPIRVSNPRLNDDDVRELTAQLGEVLQGEVT